MKRRIVLAGVAAAALTAMAIGVLALTSGPVGASSPTIAPEPYEAAHAWAWSGNGTISIPTGDRVVITDANLSSPSESGCAVSGVFNRSAVTYTFPSSQGNYDSVAVWSGLNDYLDGSSPAVAGCGQSQYSVTLSGYTVPLR
jgi:hypothetical protein